MSETRYPFCMYAHFKMRGLGLFVILGLAWCPFAVANENTKESFFVDETGIPTLTNSPERYRSDNRFQEVRIKYEPIYAPNHYDFSSGGRIATEADYRSIIRRYARHYRISESLLTAVIKAESNFDRFALSKAGAQGLMQLMPATAEEMSVRDPYDPLQNIAGGSQYLSKLLGFFDNDIDLALAAYNAGPGTVQKYGTVPPFPETRAYIERVKRHMDSFASGREQIRINSHSTRPTKRFRPTEKAPFVLHFKSGRSQPAHHVSELGEEYILTYGRRRLSIAKALVERIEQIP